MNLLILWILYRLDASAICYVFWILCFLYSMFDRKEN